MDVILVPNGVSKFLGDAFKRSQPFVRKALRGKTKHPDALRIRELALQKGGAVKQSK